MHAPPADLSVSDLRTALVSGWRIEPSSIAYAPVGFGSHHWTVVEPSSRRWFVTADAVTDSSTRLAELSAALRTAFTLRRDAGLEVVGAPVQRLDGGLLQTSGRYATALFPNLDVVTETTDHRSAAQATAPSPTARLLPAALGSGRPMQPRRLVLRTAPSHARHATGPAGGSRYLRAFVRWRSGPALG